MNIPETVWRAYRREQARLRQLEALRSVALASGSTAYLQVEKRVLVRRRRLRRLDLLLARVYARVFSRRVASYTAQDDAGDGQAACGTVGAQVTI